MSHTLNPYRRGTQLHAVSELLLQGKTREEIFRETYPLVMNQVEPFIFSDNVNGRRIPKPLGDQVPLLFYHIGRIRNDLLKKEPNAINYVRNEYYSETSNYNNKRWRARLFQTMAEERRNAEIAEIEVAIEANEESPVISEPVNREDQTTLRGKLEYLYRRLTELREFVQSKKVAGRDFDYISTRVFVYGREAVIQGIMPDDFLWSIGANWDVDTRRAAGLDYQPNYAAYAIEDTPLLLGFMVRLAKARIPIYLCGPTGSGKSVYARMLADYLELDYAEIPLSLGVSRTDLFGSWNAKGFVDRPFTRLYGNGGVFCFEEIDASDPNILLAVNNSIANDSLFNASNGEEIEKSDDFVAIATANTWGNGQTANYGGREGLDGSTLDRFKYGRIFVDYNTDIEAEIMFADIEELEAATV